MTIQTLARVAAVAALLFATPGFCLAADEHGGGKPDVLSPNLVNSLVTLVVFGGLLAVLYTAAWPKIQAGLAAREEAQFRALNEAKKAQQEAEALRGKLAQEMDAAAARIKAMLDEARKDAEALRAEQREVGVKEAQAERERAKRDAAAERESLQKEITEQAVRLAALIAEKALRRSVTIEDHGRLLDESLAELRAAANKA